MIADIQKGGIKFPDLDTIIMTQQICWIKRFFFSPYHSWKDIFIWQLNKIQGIQILENTSLDTKYIQESTALPFYKNILLSWYEWIKEDVDEHNILNQQLYLNRYIIRPNQQSIKYPRLQNKSIAYIKDILTDSYEVIPADRMKLLKNLNTVEFMQYLSISQCISADIKRCITRCQLNEMPTPIERNYFDKRKAALKTISPKRLYDMLLLRSVERPSSEEKINQLLSLELTSDDWELIYKLPFLATIESKLRALQFKITHNVYFTNERLYTIHISDTPLCTFCKEHTETIEHLFVTCAHVTSLWNLVCNVLDKTHSIRALSTADKILGMFQRIDQSEYDIINHLIISIKYYIHICKHRNNLPNRKDLIEKIKDIAQIEKKNCNKKR